MLAEGQEGNDDADLRSHGEIGGIAKRDPQGNPDRPDQGQDDVLEVGKVIGNGAEDVGELAGLGRVEAKGVVEFIEPFFGFAFVVEDLDDLLAGDHLLDVAVSGSQSPLLGDEEAGGLVRDEDDDGQDDREEGEHDKSELPRRGKHRHQGDDHGHQRLDDHGQDPAREFAEGVDVIGVDRHDVPVGAGIKIRQRKRLHVGEDGIAEPLLEPLSDHGDHDLVEIGGEDADDVDPGHDQDPLLKGKRAEDRGPDAFQGTRFA